MSDPRDRGAASPPPTLGEGCTRRYDPDALSAEDGADFAGAEALWRRLEQERENEDAKDEEAGGGA